MHSISEIVAISIFQLFSRKSCYTIQKRSWIYPLNIYQARFISAVASIAHHVFRMDSRVLIFIWNYGIICGRKFCWHRHSLMRAHFPLKSLLVQSMAWNVAVEHYAIEFTFFTMRTMPTVRFEVWINICWKFPSWKSTHSAITLIFHQVRMEHIVLNRFEMAHTILYIVCGELIKCTEVRWFVGHRSLVFFFIIFFSYSLLRRPPFSNFVQ